MVLRHDHGSVVKLCTFCKLSGVASVVNFLFLPRHTTIHVSLIFENILCIMKYTTKINQFSFRSLIPPPYKAQLCPADTVVAIVPVLVQRLWFESVLTTLGGAVTLIKLQMLF